MTNAANTPAIGTRIYYTGDMANDDAEGTVVNHLPNRLGPRYPTDITVEWDTDKPDSRIDPSHMTPHPGRRFRLLSEVQVEHDEAMAQLRASLKKS